MLRIARAKFCGIGIVPQKKPKFATVMEQTVTIHGKTFGIAISDAQIAQAVGRIGAQISEELAGKDPLFICLLNGSYVFAADLLRAIPFNTQISFVKVASYHGMEAGSINSLIGLTEDVTGRTVVLVEDIIDSGNTVHNMRLQLAHLGAADIRVATVLFKPQAFRHSYRVDYVGFEITNEFVIGYGMDYDGLGRNLKDIYQLI